MPLFACKCLNVQLQSARLAQLLPATATATNGTNDRVAAAAEAGGAGASYLESLVQAACIANNNKQLSVDKLQEMQRSLAPLDDARVAIQQPDLVRAAALNRPAGGSQDSSCSTWHRQLCIGCDCWTHLTNGSGQLVLINPEILTTPEHIAHLKTAANYTPTFQLLLNLSSRDAVEFSISANMAAARQRSASLSSARGADAERQRLARHSHLTRNFREAVQREIEATDARIRHYTEQQFAQLAAYRERAQIEYQALVKLAHCAREADEMPAAGGGGDVVEPVERMATDATEANGAEARLTTTSAAVPTVSAVAKQQPMLETPPATPDSTPMSIGNSPNFSRPPVVSTLLANSLNAQRSAAAAAAAMAAASVAASPFKAWIAPLRSSLQQQLQQQPNTTINNNNNNSIPMPQPFVQTANSANFARSGVTAAAAAASLAADDDAVEEAVDAFFFEMDDDAPASTTSPTSQPQAQALAGGGGGFSFLSRQNSNSSGTGYQHHKTRPPLGESTSIDETDSEDDATDQPGSAGAGAGGLAGGDRQPDAGGLKIPATRGGLSVAKSMPIAISFGKESGLSLQRSVHEEDEYDEFGVGIGQNGDDPEAAAAAEASRDIAASIKALARSVHGEALFGDLPRPRFRTQI